MTTSTFPTKKAVLRTILDFALIFVGAVVAAFAIEELLVPCLILDGGVVGVSIIISTLSGFPLSILTLIVNFPFLIIGLIKIGKQFFAKTLFAMVVFSVSMNIFETFIDLTREPLLAVVFGGCLLGLGVGLVIRYGGCLDGTEIVAIIVQKKFRLPVGRTVLFLNVIIYSVAGILFGFDRAMYSLLTYFITSKVLDYVESGIEKAKAAMIITDDAPTVSEEIHKRLGRTVTIMEGEGLVSSGKKYVLYCVLTSFEIRELRNIVNSIDASSFVAISDVSEIIGNHIKKKKVIPPTNTNTAEHGTE